jgi:ribosomal protein L37AE/L43A
MRHGVKVNINDNFFAICNGCYKETKKLLNLDIDDEPTELIAKVMALRTPKKAAKVAERLKKYLQDEIIWEKILLHAQFLRKQVKKERERIQKEAEKKREKQLETILNLLEAEISGTGLEFELLDFLTAGKNRCTIKLAVYPWGTTFLEGSLKEISSAVHEIIETVQETSWICPFCRKEITWEIAVGKRKCKCGAKAIKSNSRYAGEYLHSNDAWQKIEKELQKKYSKEKWNLYSMLLKSGIHIEDLIFGVKYLGKVFSWPAYMLKGNLELKSQDKIIKNEQVALTLGLLKLGYKYRVNRWAGNIDGIDIEISLKESYEKNIAVVLNTNQIPERCGWEDNQHKKWEDFLIDNYDTPSEYTVTDLTDKSEYYAEGFIYSGDIPEFSSETEAAKWLETMLKTGISTYTNLVSRFLSDNNEKKDKKEKMYYCLKNSDIPLGKCGDAWRLKKAGDKIDVIDHRPFWKDKKTPVGICLDAPLLVLYSERGLINWEELLNVKLSDGKLASGADVKVIQLTEEEWESLKSKDKISLKYIKEIINY